MILAIHTLMHDRVINIIYIDWKRVSNKIIVIHKANRCIIFLIHSTWQPHCHMLQCLVFIYILNIPQLKQIRQVQPTLSFWQVIKMTINIPLLSHGGDSYLHSLLWESLLLKWVFQQMSNWHTFEILIWVRSFTRKVVLRW